MERLEDRKDLCLLTLAINLTPEGAKPREGSVRSDKRRAVKASEVAVDRDMFMFPGNLMLIWRIGIIMDYYGGWRGDARVR